MIAILLPNIERLREQNICTKYISIAMKVIEYRTTADNIISNKNIDQMQKCLFQSILEQHSIGGTTLPSASSYSEPVASSCIPLIKLRKK